MAIAYDYSNADSQSGSSATIQHTCSGSNRILFVGVYANSSNTSGVTHNGSAMTNINTYTNGSQQYSLWYIANPATGSRDIVATLSASSTAIYVVSQSYTGTAGTIDNNTTNNGSSISGLTTSLTTSANNCWTVLFARCSVGTPGADTGSTLRGSVTHASGFDSNGAITPAGSYSMSVSCVFGAMAVCMASFGPTVNNYTRSLSDSSSYGASRTVDIARLATMARGISASISNSASRFVTISRLGTFKRGLSDSLMNSVSRLAVLSKGAAAHLTDSMMNSASRFVTINRLGTFGRAISDSISNGASRLATITRLGTFSRTISASIMNSASRFVSIGRLGTFGRAISDSISNGASRYVSVNRFFSYTRSISDSMMNSVSRFVTIAKVQNRVRNLSDSIMNGASRFVTLSRFGSFGRVLSDSMMNSASRFVKLVTVNPFHTLWRKVVVSSTAWIKKVSGQ